MKEQVARGPRNTNMSKHVNHTSLALAVLTLTSVGLAGDWPQWGGTNERNMVAKATGLPTKFHPGKYTSGIGFDPATAVNVKWSAQLGTLTYGNPTVAGGRILVGANDCRWSDPRIEPSKGGLVMCFDERTGKLLWGLPVPRYRKKVYGSGFDDMSVGLCSAPTIDGNRAYVVTNRAEVLCLDLRGQANGNDGPFVDEGQYMAGRGRKPAKLNSHDADIIWRFDMMAIPTAPHDASNCNILRVGDCLYINTSNGVHRRPDEPDPLPDAPSLIVLHRKTGKLIAVDGELIGRRMFHGQWSSPSVGLVNGKTQIYFGGGDGVLYAFEPADPNHAEKKPATLKKIWQYDCNPREFRFDADGWKRDYWDGDGSRADIDENYVGPSEIIATPAFHKGKVYVAVGQDPVHGEAKGILHCINPAGKGNITKTGCVWSYKGIGRTMSTTSIADGLLYVADFGGEIHCLDAGTGKVHWTHKTEQPIWSSTLVADGKVYVGTEKKHLWVFQAGRAKKILATLKLRHKISTTPAIANGVMYIATNRYLHAVAKNAGTKEN